MPKSLEEERATRHKYYVEHLEEFKARYRKNYKEHAEQLKAYQRRYYQEHKEYVKSRERKHAHEHLEETRPRRMAYQRKFRLENPDYSREQCRKYYVKHRAKEIERKTELGRKRWQKLNDMKANLQCSRCGQSFPDCPSVIEFHHTGRDPKEAKVSELMVKGASSKRLQAEVAKCVPLCANCHRILHDDEKQKKRGF
jgi:hypothetical protein